MPSRCVTGFSITLAVSVSNDLLTNEIIAPLQSEGVDYSVEPSLLGKDRMQHQNQLMAWNINNKYEGF